MILIALSLSTVCRFLFDCFYKLCRNISKFKVSVMNEKGLRKTKSKRNTFLEWSDTIIFCVTIFLYKYVTNFCFVFYIRNFLTWFCSELHSVVSLQVFFLLLLLKALFGFSITYSLFFTFLHLIEIVDIFCFCSLFLIFFTKFNLKRFYNENKAFETFVTTLKASSLIFLQELTSVGPITHYFNNDFNNLSFQV